MSHIKQYIEKSLLIPPDAKASLSAEHAHAVVKEEMACFMDSYSALEQEIIKHVNKELETLNSQVRNYLQSKEAEMRKQELHEMELEIAYL